MTTKSLKGRVVCAQRPEERALGDVLIPEEITPGGASAAEDGDSSRVGISAEPPGFLKRLFSVPKNVRRTAAAGDVVVPVIGARDGWGGIRQARFIFLHCPTYARMRMVQALRCHYVTVW